MVSGLLVIVVCQLVGEFVVRVFGLPIPGPVLGMVFFFVILQVRRPGPDAAEVRAADALLAHLPLFFVPAGVGIVVYLPRLLDEWLPVIVGLHVSWLVTIVVTGGVAMLLRPRRSASGVAS